MAQELRKGPFGDNKDATHAFKSPERKAPDSKDILRQLDAVEVTEKERQENRKRQILKKCGCL